MDMFYHGYFAYMVDFYSNIFFAHFLNQNEFINFYVLSE